MASVTIRKAKDDEVARLAQLDVQGFRDSPFRQSVFPTALRVQPGDQDQIDYIQEIFQKSLANPCVHQIVAVSDGSDGKERIVGSAWWVAPKPAGSLNSQTETKAPARKAHDFVDKEAQKLADDSIEALLKESEPSFLGRNRESMWTLNAISVDENHRGKGIGKALVRWGLEMAESSKEDVWLIASPLGRPLYKSLGFLEVAEGSRSGEPQYVMTKFREQEEMTK